MPVTLPPSVARALSDARLSPEEARDLKAAVKRGELTTADLQRLGVRFADLFGAGAGQALVAIAPRGDVPVAAPIRSLGDSRASAEVLAGGAVLSPGSKHPAVLSYQRALNALASRLEKPEWALLTSGADGVYGKESVSAVSAFQTANALPVTGNIDQATAHKMEELLMTAAPPDVGGVQTKSSLPDGERIAQAARDLVEKRGADYGTGPAWKSPNPRAPGNTRPGETALGAVGRWKCNLFGLDALYLGGAQTPHYPSGFYPIAHEIPGYSRGPSAPLIKLGEVWTTKGMPKEETDAKIQALMKIARPGDLIIVKHHGAAVADGGHTRVVVANNFAKDGTVECAQAGSSSAVVEPESLSSFSSEEAVYLLRPAQQR